MNFYENIKIGSGAAAATSIFDIASTTKGILIPRMTTAQRNAIVNPETSLFLFNTDTFSFQFYNAFSAAWTNLATGSGTGAWTFDGDSLYPNGFSQKTLSVPYNYLWWGNPTFTVGKKYYISQYVPGDDFTNIGAPSNEAGIYFYATGTTATAFTGSFLYYYDIEEDTNIALPLSQLPGFTYFIFSGGVWNSNPALDDWNTLVNYINNNLIGYPYSSLQVNISYLNGIVSFRTKSGSGGGTVSLMPMLKSSVPHPFLIPTNNTLIVGEVYEIVNYVSPDDYTNVGAVSNVDGEIFRATGSTPTVFSNGTFLKQYRTFSISIGSPLVVGKTYEIASYDSLDDFSNIGGTNASNTFFIATGSIPNAWSNSVLTLVKPISDSTFIIGETYEIQNYSAGDNFTNIGATNNQNGEVFVATGTTPAVWTNNTGLIHRYSTLEIGATYEIVTFVPGDDFTNVGAISNTVGEKFDASGTTPTSWAWNTNGSILNKLFGADYSVDGTPFTTPSVQSNHTVGVAYLGDPAHSPQATLGYTSILDGLIVGNVDTGGYVAGREHAVQILANNNAQTALTAIGGGAIIQMWKDATPTLAASIGLGVPGLTPDYNFHISRWSPGWTSVVTVNTTTGSFGIGKSNPNVALHIGIASGDANIAIEGGGATRYLVVEGGDQAGPGSPFNINAGPGFGPGAGGGDLLLLGGGSATATGGNVNISGGTGATAGNVTINANGGKVIIGTGNTTTSALYIGENSGNADIHIETGGTTRYIKIANSNGTNGSNLVVSAGDSNDTFNASSLYLKGGDSVGGDGGSLHINGGLSVANVTSDIFIQEAGGRIGIGTGTSSSKVTIDYPADPAAQLRLVQSFTPTSTNDTSGNVGDIAWDDDYFYIKTNLGWGRVGRWDYAF